MSAPVIRRTRITHRDFTCKSPSAHHQFRAAVKIGVTDDGTSVERSAEFLVLGVASGAASWFGIPLCPTCGALAEESSTYDPSGATVPESQRLKVWLSADGKRVAIPGNREAPMRERYAVAGYREIEAHSMRDIDRIMRIREEQTGNSLDTEMNYDPTTRAWNMDKPYDPDDMKSAY